MNDKHDFLAFLAFLAVLPKKTFPQRDKRLAGATKNGWPLKPQGQPEWRLASLSNSLDRPGI